MEWREWDGDFVVFNAASGDTHFLNALAAVVLQALEAQPATIEELLARIEQEAATPLGDELAERVRSLVETLDELGLIEPA